ncbi:hypothetical protein GCM10010363_35930 [Streptomyces omiyaensis]|nr:hypothetical protein GCM10010363_35930 [Streptomyces omiyaensis]
MDGGWASRTTGTHAGGHAIPRILVIHVMMPAAVGGAPRPAAALNFKGRSARSRPPLRLRAQGAAEAGGAGAKEPSTCATWARRRAGG